MIDNIAYKEPLVVGKEHWTSKGDVKLFIWEKKLEKS